MPPLVVMQATPTDSPCGACKALYGATCCETKTREGPRLPMTFGEASRIARHVGVDVKDAVVVRHGVGEVERTGLQITAGSDAASLVVSGSALYLPVRAGSCVYLGPEGCTVPGVKPHLCAMFPFTKGARGWEIGRLVRESGFCYGQDVVARNLHAAFEIFGTSAMELNATWSRWAHDKRDHRSRMRAWLKGLAR